MRRWTETQFAGHKDVDTRAKCEGGFIDSGDLGRRIMFQNETARFDLNVLLSTLFTGSRPFLFRPGNIRLGTLNALCSVCWVTTWILMRPCPYAELNPSATQIARAM